MSERISDLKVSHMKRISDTVEGKSAKCRKEGVRNRRGTSHTCNCMSQVYDIFSTFLSVFCCPDASAKFLAASSLGV
jgi:hypothetical protein